MAPARARLLTLRCPGSAPDDVRNLDLVRTLVADLEHVRRVKMQQGIEKVFDTVQQGNLPSVIKVRAPCRAARMRAAAA